MAQVNDGTAKWELNYMYNAGQLNGLTATQIQNNAINSAVSQAKVKVYGFKGTVTTKENRVQIPIPSGFSAANCMFIVKEYMWGQCNPDTGIVSGLNTDVTTTQFQYLIVAVK